MELDNTTISFCPSKRNNYENLLELLSKMIIRGTSDNKNGGKNKKFHLADYPPEIDEKPQRFVSLKTYRNKQVEMIEKQLTRLYSDPNIELISYIAPNSNNKSSGLQKKYALHKKLSDILFRAIEVSCRLVHIYDTKINKFKISNIKFKDENLDRIIRDLLERCQQSIKKDVHMVINDPAIYIGAHSDICQWPCKDIENENQQILELSSNADNTDKTVCFYTRQEVGQAFLPFFKRAINEDHVDDNDDEKYMTTVSSLDPSNRFLFDDCIIQVISKGNTSDCDISKPVYGIYKNEVALNDINFLESSIIPSNDENVVCLPCTALISFRLQYIGNMATNLNLYLNVDKIRIPILSTKADNSKEIPSATDYLKDLLTNESVQRDLIDDYGIDPELFTNNTKNEEEKTLGELRRESIEYSDMPSTDDEGVEEEEIEDSSIEGSNDDEEEEEEEEKSSNDDDNGDATNLIIATPKAMVVTTTDEEEDDGEHVSRQQQHQQQQQQLEGSYKRKQSDNIEDDKENKIIYPPFKTMKQNIINML